MDQQKTEEEIKQELKEMEEQNEEPVRDMPVDEAGPEPEEVAPKVEVREEIPKKLVEDVKFVASGPSRLDRLKLFINECKRVLRVTKKPNKQEFSTIVKISAIGMGVIGFLGFIVFFIKEMLF